MGEHGDVAMPETDQMPHGFIAAACRSRRAPCRSLASSSPRSRRTVGGRRAPRAAKRRHRGVARRHGDEAVDAPADQRLDPPLFYGRVLAGRGEQEIVAVALGERLDAVDEAGEKDVGDVGDDHADEAGRGAAQRARGAVDPVAELFDRFENATPARLADGPVAVRDVGRGRDRNPGARGDIANGGRPRQKRSFPCARQRRTLVL